MARPTAAPSPRTRVRRLPDRGHYDRATVDAIVDEALTCTVAFQWEGGVHAITTAHWREGDHLYVHGAKASRMLKALPDADACVNISLVDGLVFARCGFNHSMNYRSVVVYGRFETVDDPARKLDSLHAFMDKLSPGRWDTLRPTTKKELNATTVLRMSLAEASAKIRAWGAKDDDADLDWPVWAGVVPLRVARGRAETDPRSAVPTPPKAKRR